MADQLRTFGNQCPTCGAITQVTDSRALVGGIRRRRECVNKHRFTTYEHMSAPKKFSLRLLDEDLDEIRAVIEKVHRRGVRLAEIFEEQEPRE